MRPQLVRRLAAAAAPTPLPLPLPRCLPRSIPLRARVVPAKQSQSSWARTYHSHDHPPPPGPFGDAELAILSAAYAHVPELGFTSQALVQGARDAGLLDVSVSLLPDGAFGLVRYHLTTTRKALAERKTEILQAGKGGSAEGESPVSAKVERLAWERLLANAAVIHHWQDALAMMAQPSYAPTALQELALLADEIWYLAGDKDVGPAWYTKRASLSTIYASTELFMTNDRSPDFHETREFLSRRFGEVKELGGILGAVGQWVGFTASAGVNVLRSKGVRV